MFLKLWHCQIIWYLLAGYKTIILCFVLSIGLVKYVSSVEIWFVKTSTRIIKFEPRVIKLNPVSVFLVVYDHFLVVLTLAVLIPDEKKKLN